MRFKRTHPERDAMLARLYELRREAKDRCAARRLDDYILYAEIGKDRRKLGMEWARKAEEAVARGREFDELLANIARGDL